MYGEEGGINHTKQNGTGCELILLGSTGYEITLRTLLRKIRLSAFEKMLTSFYT